MLLNLIVFKFVPGILKYLDAWWMSFFCFLFIFNCKFIFIKKKKINEGYWRSLFLINLKSAYSKLFSNSKWPIKRRISYCELYNTNNILKISHHREEQLGSASISSTFLSFSRHFLWALIQKFGSMTWSRMRQGYFKFQVYWRVLLHTIDHIWLLTWSELIRFCSHWSYQEDLWIDRLLFPHRLPENLYFSDNFRWNTS